MGGPQRGIGRWLNLTRNVGARIRRVPAEDEPTPPPTKSPDQRGVLERLPAPRGQDALHDRSSLSTIFNWFSEDEQALKKGLAQRASEVLAGLGPLQLPARQVGDGQPGGLHRSLRRGGGIEFSEHKEYAPSDDLRHLDWKAYARTDRYYIKRFEQEVHATMTLVLDASASMQLVDLHSDKFDAARLLLAAVALVLVRQGDSVGLVVLGQPELTMAPSTGLRHFANLCERLERTSPEGQAGIDTLHPGAQRGLDHRGLALVASDALLEPQTAIEPLGALRRAGLDVLLLQTLHPLELDLGFAAPAQFTCRETDRRVVVDPRVIRDAYVDLIRAHCDGLRVAATHAGVGYLLVDTSVEPRGMIRQVLRATARLKRRGQPSLGGGAYSDDSVDTESILDAAGDAMVSPPERSR